VIGSIKICKQKIKEDLGRGQDIRLQTDKRRRDALLEEIKLLENQLEIARQTDESKRNDLIRDNQKLKAENNELWESVRKKNEDTREKKPISHVSYYQRQFTVQDRWHNPGGSDICTPSNAQNSMVYNEYTGIYAP
jgi:hypothetical protein